jgi:arylsulfatase A-like enzyme
VNATKQPDPRIEAPSRVLLLALWFGTWTGLAVFMAYLAGKLLRDRAVHLDPQLIWMSPAANVILFGLAATIIIGAGVAWPRVRARGVVLGTFFSFAVFSGALLYPRINRWAMLVLSIGVGIQLGRVVASRLDALLPWIRRTLVAGIAIVIVGASMINMRLALTGRDDVAGLPEAPAGAPNVLLIILDTVRAFNLGLYGYDRPTSPFLDELARRGVVFDNAFVSAPWTLPSHGSMFTGHWPFELTASWQEPLDDRHPVIAEALRDRGYVTGGFVANYLFGPDVYGLGRGFTHYSGWPHSFATMIDTSPVFRFATSRFNRTFGYHYTPERRTADDIVREFLRWKPADGERPWFAFLNLFDAHEPYHPPAPWATRFGDPRHRRIEEEMPSDEVVRDLTDAYDGGIAYMDDVLRALFDALEAGGSLDNTLVIVASDHGEHLGERNLIDHGNSLFSPLLHVPLIVAWPGRLPAGLRVDTAVSLRNIAATIADLAPATQAFPGRSLSRFWNDGGDTSPDTVYAAVEFAPRQPPWYPLAKGDIRSVIDWPWHYILYGDDSEELLDLTADPRETGPPGQNGPALDRLRRLMAAFPEHVTAR